ncbi:MAG: hypothetical protein IJX25_03815 [Clostridia bacterium]|nr:hypothetical protein [Clostridia bacterium]
MKTITILKNMFNQKFGIKEENLLDDEQILQLINSLDFAECICELEEFFEIEILDGEIYGTITIKELADLVDEKLNEKEAELQ